MTLGKKSTAFLLCAGVFTCAYAVNPQQQWNFRALLDGEPIGYHRFQSFDDGIHTLLHSEAEFEVKFLLLSVYDYSHQATERWRDGCLQEIEAVTNDNDTLFEISGSLVKDDVSNPKFMLQTLSSSGSRDNEQLPGCVMSFAYWNPSILEQSRLLDPQTGAYLDVNILEAGEETLPIGDTRYRAKRYRLSARDLDITLWYSQDSMQWLGLESITPQGYTLRYELLPNASALAAKADR